MIIKINLKRRVTQIPVVFFLHSEGSALGIALYSGIKY
jgi:hypothetical protein